mmetsp:Transcript_14092/g.25124  ORF Transcript_14092/g.25124 Transcript_14092/m.25124 type:complete len:96 (+) Transcript_14092:1881-2168(+)
MIGLPIHSWRKSERVSMPKTAREERKMSRINFAAFVNATWRKREKMEKITIPQPVCHALIRFIGNASVSGCMIIHSAPFAGWTSMNPRPMAIVMK